MPHLSEEACLGLLIMKTGSPSHRGAVIAALRVHEAIKCWSGALNCVLVGGSSTTRRWETYPSSSRARWGWVGSLGAIHIDIRV